MFVRSKLGADLFEFENQDDPIRVQATIDRAFEAGVEQADIEGNNGIITSFGYSEENLSFINGTRRYKNGQLGRTSTTHQVRMVNRNHKIARLLAYLSLWVGTGAVPDISVFKKCCIETFPSKSVKVLCSVLTT
ncbi:hypothetical protein BLNAU_17116 [Blattamonas nauphoetae]|uniref:Uncharacterized protein n=1 Tax=Blattamonas nauphoetae TaxID=2049346 RepID=A0ABQ9X7V4_9EUKA|nr:hypothetical protein BLNAU_17116 [Blattamonas nauphoetae]